MALLEQRPDRYLHAPRLVSQAAGGATLTLIAWESAGERVLQVELGPDGAPSEERLGPLTDGIVTLTRGERVQASDDPRHEHEETRAGERVHITHERGIASVWLDRADRKVLVFRARGMAAAATLAACPGGTWVAFHHDVREDQTHSDVAKWIALRFVSEQGSVLEPSAPFTERDRDRQGVEQSFEFPALVVGSDGAVALFGRGSHNYYRQDLSALGFAPRSALSDGEWGSRGRHIAAASVRDGIVVARRERKGIAVDLLPPVSGGPPALQETRVDLGCAADPSLQSPLSLEGRGAGGEAHVLVSNRDPARAHGRVTLFGDIQQHSAHSDGLGSADEVYLRARYRYGDDFVALTDHESFLGKRTGPGEWEYLQRVADQHAEADAFVTLYAYEWTGKMHPGPGHKCVYYPRRGIPIVSRDELPEGREAVARIHALGGFASPHHIGWTGADEPGHDPLGQPLWEICSCHGCYEHPEHPLGQRGTLRDQLIDVMLARGHRFGFTASSDSHGLLWHHGEARKRDPYRTGLTAVQAEGKTRDAVMRALTQRRCYATSGAKILLDLTADGQPMGSELPRSHAHLTVRAVGTGPIARIELVTERGVVHSTPAHSEEATLDARVEGRFVYARVVQEDGEMAWSSPVFLGA